MSARAASHDIPGMLKHDFLRHAERQDRLSQGVEVTFMGIALDVSEAVYRYHGHDHENHELILVDRGRYRCVLNGDELSLRAGDALVVCPGDRHQDICEPPLRYYTLWYNLRHAVHGSRTEQIALLRRDLRTAARRLRPERRVVWPLLGRLMDENEHGDEFSDAIQNGIAHQLFWSIVRGVPRENVNPLLLTDSREELLRFRLYRAFERLAGRPASVPELADALDMSESSLAHRCRKELGVTPARAFTEFRIGQACALLSQTDMNVKEVSARCGYSDACHFIHVFKSVTATTPARYRTRAARHPDTPRSRRPPTSGAT